MYTCMHVCDKDHDNIDEACFHIMINYMMELMITKYDRNNDETHYKV